jgi:hypothetical protein
MTSESPRLQSNESRLNLVTSESPRLQSSESRLNLETGESPRLQSSESMSRYLPKDTTSYSLQPLNATPLFPLWQHDRVPYAHSARRYSMLGYIDSIFLLLTCLHGNSFYCGKSKMALIVHKLEDTRLPQISPTKWFHTGSSSQHLEHTITVRGKVGKT